MNNPSGTSIYSPAPVPTPNLITTADAPTNVPLYVKAGRVFDRGLYGAAQVYLAASPPDPVNKTLWNQSIAAATQEEESIGRNDIHDIAVRATQIYQQNGGPFVYALVNSSGQQLQIVLYTYIDQAGQRVKDYVKKGISNGIPFLWNQGLPYAFQYGKNLIWSDAVPLAEEAGSTALEYSPEIAEGALFLA